MGASIPREHLKEIAQSYYVRDNLTPEQIGDKLPVSSRTISRWAKEGNWKELKSGITTARQTQLHNLHRQIAEMNELINLRDEGYRFPSKEEALILTRLTTAVKKFETENADISQIVSVSIEFLNWMKTVDRVKAQEMSAYFDAFITDKAAR